MEEENLIITLSGIRGIAEKDLNFNIVKKIAIAYGLWFEGRDKRVIIGRDTRSSGKIIERALIEGLITTGFNVINLGICPTPVIIHAKNKHNIPGGIIITGSHNPQEWNGLKLLYTKTFLDTEDLEKIFNSLNEINLHSYTFSKKDLHKNVKNLDPIPDYIQDLYKYIDFKGIKDRNNLRVVIDTGAGAGKFATPQVLSRIGCEVKLINNDLLVNETFPREIEPIERNLRDLIMEVWQGKYDVGFAHDSDGDRLALIGDDGTCYPEDIGLALIAEYYLKNQREKGKEIIFVTNFASSLRFEAIAEKYNAQVVRTPIGERFLTEKMDFLIEEGNLSSKNRLVFGGEGSCGGVIFPYFNVTRDGVFAAAKIIEILVKTGKNVSDLVSKLPKYYSHREKISYDNKKTELIINQVKKELIEEGEEVDQKDLDLRFGQGKEWFVLIHPSNTEPIIRIISEARRNSLARIHCEATSELVKLVIARM